MEIVALIIAVIALVIAVLAYVRAGGVEEMRSQVKSVGSATETLRTKAADATETVREKTADALDRLGRAVRGSEEHPSPTAVREEKRAETPPPFVPEAESAEPPPPSAPEEKKKGS